MLFVALIENSFLEDVASLYSMIVPTRIPGTSKFLMKNLYHAMNSITKVKHNQYFFVQVLASC